MALQLLLRPGCSLNSYSIQRYIILNTLLLLIKSGPKWGWGLEIGGLIGRKTRSDFVPRIVLRGLWADSDGTGCFGKLCLRLFQQKYNNDLRLAAECGLAAVRQPPHRETTIRQTWRRISFHASLSATCAPISTGPGALESSAYVYSSKQ